jgi:hypothetical protein
MEHPNTSFAQEDESVMINVPEELLTAMRKSCAEKASVSLLGRIQGKHPGLKALTAWARDTLHSSLILLSIKANNLFEVTFSSIEGRTHALTQADLTCEAANIIFSSWQPHFDAKTPQDQDQLDFPIWVQVVDLCQIMREEAFLRTIGEHIGQVIAIDNSELYRAKLFGPRIRILVKDLNKLPPSIKVPRLDREGIVVHKLEYSGFPNQCGRCRSRDHQVRHCPKKDTKIQRKDPIHNSQPEGNTKLPGNHIEHMPREQENYMSTDLQKEPMEEAIQANTEGEITTTVQPEADHHSPIEDPAPDQRPQPEEPDPHPPELQPNDENFPQLNSPGPGAKSPTPSPITQQPATPQTFIWRQKPAAATTSESKGKEKAKVESTPITRQGYRSGRLADDFWEVLNIPGTPSSQKRKLRVIPFLTKNFSHTEYLVDNSKHPYSNITTVHIAEVLAGIPWSLLRVKQHIVNETAQALHKVLMFNNQHNTPFQTWDQGLWFSQWEKLPDGEHVCTLYVSIAAPESKIKIRKGRKIGWRAIPESIKTALTSTQTDTIQEVAELKPQWQIMTGKRDFLHTRQQAPTPTESNPFSVLNVEEEQSS